MRSWVILHRLIWILLIVVVLLLSVNQAQAHNLARGPGSIDSQRVQPSQGVPITRTLKMTSEIPPNWVPPTAGTLNGLPLDSFIVMPPNVIDHVRSIYARGQALKRNPHAFMRIGDSTIEFPYFFIAFDQKRYKLGVYEYLQPTIDYYAGYFSRRSAAAKVAQHSWTVTNPAWVNRSDCKRGETPIACELRLANPSIALIRLGTNDAGNIKLFEKNLRPLIEDLIDQGVIPILSTKADRQPGMLDVNHLMRQWATEYTIPLWDLDVVMEGMPTRGLWRDGVHMTNFAPMDYTDAIAYQRGHAMQNLTALMALDRVRRVVSP